jgi:DNA-binding transcriptional LysR family regulator
MASKSAALDWEALRYFSSAGRIKSLSGAARALGVEHTTVGRRLSSLEQALGAALVERGPAGLSLTRLGRRVFRSTQEMERIAAAIAALAVVERARVRLVVPTGFTALLAPHLQELSRTEPSLSLEIVSSARRVDLRRREADLAVRVGPIQDDGLVARRLGDVGSALYGSRSYLSRNPEVDLDDLSGHSVIGFQRSLAATPAAQWLAERCAGAKIVLRSREAVDLLTAVKSGGGLAVLPCFLGDAEPALVRLSPGPVATRRLSLGYRRDGRLSRELRAVVSLVVESLHEHARELSGR